MTVFVRPSDPASMTPSSGDLSAERRDTGHHPEDDPPLNSGASGAVHRPAGERWRERGPFGLLLLGTALLYLIGLSRSGWANQFYSAAAQAGSRSWKAFFFGSLDPSNFITVDKPPASLWVMDISVKVFGVNPWAILVPQALEGVAAVAILYAAVRRISGPNAGLVAGAALATTPIATLMFRFDNPDALLVLLMTAAAYATIRAVELAGPRWLMLAGALIGLAFLTKMLQGLLVLPAFALAYLIAAPTPLRKRILHVLAAGAAMVVGAGWWIAIVELWPSGSRPYIGGSTNNSILQLVLGYNGIGRLTGADNNGSVGGQGGGGFSSSETGWTRLFGSEMGSQISWLLPAALVALVALGWVTARAARTDLLRAQTIIWGGWLLVTGIVFSFASGIIHPYYTVALAPAIAALVGVGVVELWRRRTDDVARWSLAALVAASAWWTYDLLGRVSWHPELRWIVAVGGGVSVAAVLAVGRLGRFAVPAVAPLIALTLLIAPAAYSLQTASTAHTGAIPSAGPASAGGIGGFGGRPGGAGGGFGRRPNGAAPGGFGGRPNSAVPGAGAVPGSGAIPRTGAVPGAGAVPGSGAGGRRGGFGGGGGLGGATPFTTALTTALKVNASSYAWVAATTGDNEAASLELATGESVMALGGYNGTDPSISLAAFEKLATAGKIHYYLPNAQGFIGSGSSTTSSAYAIQQWVAANYTATTIGGSTVYDLTMTS